MKKSELTNRLFLVAIILLVCRYSGYCQEYAYEAGEVAVGGYDITTYFDQDLQKGTKSIQTTFDGVIYYFVNEANLNKFKKNPDKFIPAYGGWCAMALCQNKLVEPNPKLFSIIDDKLHLFEVKVFYNGKAEWFKNPETNKSIADEKYQQIINPDNN
jgi:YHS domain-containing protein